jgi:heme-degrading monooxygenase HmoA
MIREKSIPAAQQMPGFKGAYWLRDRRTGKGVNVSLWENERSLDASRQQASQIRTQGTQALGLKVVSVEEFEVIASVAVAESASRG